MGQLALFGVYPWVSTWLTPLWLMSVGVVCGLIVLVAVWGLAAAAARVPALGKLADDPRLRIKLATAGMLITVPIYWWLVSKAWFGGGNSLGANFFFGAIALVPICWILPYAFIMLMARRTVSEVKSAVQEGVLLPLFWLAVVFAVFSVVGFLAVRTPGDFLTSIKRWQSTGDFVSMHTLPAGGRRGGSDGAFSDAQVQPIDVNFRRSELRRLIFQSTERLEVTTAALKENLTSGRSIEVSANAGTSEIVQWLVNPQTLTFDFVDEQVSKLYVRNLGEKPATLLLTVVTAPPIPEVATIPITAISVVAVFLLYILQRAAMPRLSAVALSTFKSEVAQPLFAILLILGTVALLLFVIIPYNTFGEDIKMLKDSGMALITVLALIQAIWAASTSISEEIEGRTALTVLSKPINRRSFIIGKFVGITWTVALIFIILGLVLLVTVAYKPIYDVREGASYQTPEGITLEEATWQMCHAEMVGLVPGLLLAFMQTMVLAAISVAISTRLPMMANFILCFTVYVLGNLAPMIVQSSNEQFVLVKFFGQLIATVFPNLENFNIQAAVAAGKVVPLLYLAGAFLYCMIYTVIAMLLALIMFEDRDLA